MPGEVNHITTKQNIKQLLHRSWHGGRFEPLSNERGRWGKHGGGIFMPSRLVLPSHPKMFPMIREKSNSTDGWIKKGKKRKTSFTQSSSKNWLLSKSALTDGRVGRARFFSSCFLGTFSARWRGDPSDLEEASGKWKDQNHIKGKKRGT